MLFSKECKGSAKREICGFLVGCLAFTKKHELEGRGGCGVCQMSVIDAENKHPCEGKGRKCRVLFSALVLLTSSCDSQGHIGQIG